jgi:DNA-binding SARP family transcriptional activator
VDVAEFQAQVKAALGQVNAGECLEALRSAVDIYQSDFMAGFTLPDAPRFDEWQFFQAEELRRSLADALQRLIELHISRGSSTSHPLCPASLSLDPLHEPASRLDATLRLVWSSSRQPCASTRNASAF